MKKSITINMDLQTFVDELNALQVISHSITTPHRGLIVFAITIAFAAYLFM